MKIAIVGLGIIGGSYCKALKAHTKHYVIGINRTQSVAQKALEQGAIDKIGTPESADEADVVIFSACIRRHAWTFCAKTDNISARTRLSPTRRALSARSVRR